MCIIQLLCFKRGSFKLARLLKHKCFELKREFHLKMSKNVSAFWKWNILFWVHQNITSWFYFVLIPIFLFESTCYICPKLHLLVNFLLGKGLPSFTDGTSYLRCYVGNSRLNRKEHVHSVVYHIAWGCYR